MNVKNCPMKEQIEEMFNDLCDTPIGGVKEDFTIATMGDEFSVASIRTIARHLVSKGYSKHRIGRWVHNEGGSAYQPPYFCSECLADGDYDGDNPFCWNCGAKMKGGAE